jgi:hypothetical protein
MILKIWEQNKKFILIVGSGLVVFLFFNSCVSSYVGRVYGPKGLLAQSGKLERDVRTLFKEVSPRYYPEKARLEEYQKHEATLRADLELPPEKELDKLDEVAPLVQFNQAIDRTWALAQEKANRAAIPLPEKLGPQDFGVERTSTKREYERFYAYLGIIRRALHALIDSGVVEIGKPRLIQEETLPVLKDNENSLCLYRGVSFQVAGPYESFLRLLKSLQSPQNFLQVRIVGMGAKGGGDERLVKGELEFVGVRVAERSEVAEEEAKPDLKQTSHRKRVRGKSQ